MFNLDKVRADFPILSRTVYGRPLVYLDNAATTQKPLCVLDAMRDEVLAGTDGLTIDLSENTELRSLELQEEVLYSSLRAANAGRLPTLAAFGTASYTGNDMEPFMGMGAGDDSRYFWTHPISVGLQLSVPIFSGLTKLT